MNVVITVPYNETGMIGTKMNMQRDLFSVPKRFDGLKGPKGSIDHKITVAASV